jgi:hypothetical protein
MSKIQKKYSNLIFLCVFLAVTLFINFFHTEHALQTSNACPACHFQNSTLITSQITFFHLPQLSLLETLKTFETSHYNQLFFITPPCRSPPQI